MPEPAIPQLLMGTDGERERDLLRLELRRAVREGFGDIDCKEVGLTRCDMRRR